MLADRNYKPHADFRSIRRQTCRQFEHGFVRVGSQTILKESRS
jgi:hypothetical protein